MFRENLVELYEESFKENWEKEAAKDYISSRQLTYGEYAAEIEKLHILYKEAGINIGDSIAVSGKNSIAWSLIYMSALTYGAVIVPILDEFHPKDITHIINHSDAKLFFCDDDLWAKINFHDFEKLYGVISLIDGKILDHKSTSDFNAIFHTIPNKFKAAHPNGFNRESVKYLVRDKNDLALLCYTSGTTSMTKGVMLTYNNLYGNVKFGRDNYQQRGITLKSTLCVLPLAHTYGAAFNLLVQLEWGAKITFLGKIPSPNIILEACKEAKPTLLFFVPLVFEKIYKNKIEPIIKKPFVARLLKTPLIGEMIYRVIGKKIYKILGGSSLYEVIIGGAAINSEVEAFFHRARFPFLVGYGMTECAPLISYRNHKEFVPTSVGLALPGIMEVRIDKENETDMTGEIQTRGMNVMLGYYKEPQITADSFTDDHWLKTGDLGETDASGNIYIKGRSKTMLLGTSGENIYPEPIESKLANMPFVAECIIVQHNNKLEAWIYPDIETKEKMSISDKKLIEIMNDNRKTLNHTLAKFEAISSINISQTPFPKTPKRTLKRYETIEIINEEYALREEQTKKHAAEQIAKEKKEKKEKKNKHKKVTK
ncbi:MAG: AMP-binding protein [Rikenellaceae bacterium]